jgi:OTU domain-containing protein 6
MSDDESTASPLEQLRARHRQENKDMQAEVQRIKKAVPKGDNKRKKAAQTEIDTLERTTQERQAKELADLESQAKQSAPEQEASPSAGEVCRTSDDWSPSFLFCFPPISQPPCLEITHR